MRIFLVLCILFFLSACTTKEEKFHTYVLPNLKKCLYINEYNMTDAVARKCALDKCKFAKTSYGVEFSDKECVDYMRKFALKKK